ncbi:unnamed protein product [Adineta steineri]|uniref:Mucoidy inhibitor A n=1 Tax=Adineta steineri TaxID=433720 RepID=A0A814GEZ3_9BILA|nr:unnamed protein product [Adineta steineri]CAF1207231.1 unnamed protein product [Adineta steineri]CAF1484564.1 unnamed protein product [Adineta steineri]
MAEATTTTNVAPTIAAPAIPNTKLSTHRFNIDQQCAIQAVTVYNDRAEVTRLLRHHFDVEGTYDLIFEGFSPFVDQTSLHVSGGTGKACTILEVSYQTCYENTKPETDLSSLEKLQSEFNQIEGSIGVHQREVARLTKQRAWIEGRASKLMNQDGQINVNDLDAMQQFMDFYRKNLSNLDDETTKEEIEMKRLTQERDGLQTKINEYGAQGQLNRRKERREVTITVHIGAQNIDVNLEISYLISNCSWSASYDVRVSSIDVSKQRTQLTYYGIIVNKSQENWPDTQLSLSTATPSLGGAPPKLNTLKVTYYQPRYNNYQDYDSLKDGAQYLTAAGLSECGLVESSARKSRKSKPFASFRGRSSLNPKNILEEDEDETSNAVNVLSTTTEASMSSSSFAIPRRSTIDADGKPHKVTIGVLDLTSTFMYTVIPKLSLHAYLKATTTNTSDKQLLAGPISVFMDNNFVTHSTINNVCLGDTFDLPLGTDASIKVEYKPAKTIAETQGVITKTHYENIRRETRLSNTKLTDVTVYVYDQVPISSYEKIKVKLVVPDLRTKQVNSSYSVMMNDENNLEWKCLVKAKSECRLPLEYTLEWPKDKRIEFTEE